MNILNGKRLNGAIYNLSPALKELALTPLEGFTEKY